MRYSYAFDEKRRYSKRKIAFVIFVVVLVIFFVAFVFKDSSNKTVNKIANVIIYPVKAVNNLKSKADFSSKKSNKEIEEISLENQKMLEENKELKLKLLETERILKENESLKKMLDIKNVYQHFDIKLGKIILREHDNWTKTFTIDLGSEDGIKLNEAVVHTDGLVGYISSVNDKTSVVTTLLDPQTSVSVNISTINEPAILKGDLELKEKNKLKLESIPIDAEVSIADMLYTSGLGSKFPSSVPVAKIIEVVSKKNDMNRYALAQPCVNIYEISEVGVILN